jgi:hypothetical protein
MTNGKKMVIGVSGMMLFLAAATAQEPRRGASPPKAPTQSAGTRKNMPPLDAEALTDPKKAEVAAALLESAYQGQRPPEGVRMLTAILRRGADSGPGEGWFDPSENRYSWKWLAKRCGIDPAQGGISRDRFPGSTDWFARLDRNKNGAIAPEDFDWSERSPYVQMSRMASRLYRKLNAAGDGHLSKDELLHFFEKAGQGKDYLSGDDFRDALLDGLFSPSRPSDMPSKAVLIRGLFAGELGSMNEGPKLNDPAPDFTLKTADGKETIQLSKRIGPKPVILVFGSFT